MSQQKNLITEPGALFVLEDSFNKQINDRLRTSKGITYNNNERIFSRPLVSYRFDKSFRKLLESGGYTIVNDSRREPRWRMDLGQVRWWISRKIDFTTHWYGDNDGIFLFLETDPMGGGGNHQEATNLANHLEKEGYSLPLPIKEMVEAGGMMYLSWEELGIESSIRTKDLFEKFCKSFPDYPLAFYHIAQAVKFDRNHLGFDPSPFKRQNNEVYGATSRIPKSVTETVLKRWQEKWYEAADKELARFKASVPMRPIDQLVNQG